MAWKGKLVGALIGLLTTRSVWGAVVGAIIGQLFDQGTVFGQFTETAPAGATGHSAAASANPSASAVFFRTTFEMMGHVAKADGHVSESEIAAARRLMQELELGPHEISAAIAYFRAGKSAAYDVNLGVAQLLESCGRRRDLLHTFIELQMRAALIGGGMSRQARAVLARVAERVGMSGLEFSHLEASLRARQSRPGSSAGAAPSADSLARCYAELEAGANMSDKEVTKAYRRQMSRHHPDKLVANGLPESMAQMAKEKTQRVQEAYEAIRAARGMR